MTRLFHSRKRKRKVKEGYSSNTHSGTVLVHNHNRAAGANPKCLTWMLNAQRSQHSGVSVPPATSLPRPFGPAKSTECATPAGHLEALSQVSPAARTAPNLASRKNKSTDSAPGPGLQDTWTPNERQ
jgi:hypothetical protein